MLPLQWQKLRDALCSLSGNQIFALHVKVSLFLELHAEAKKNPTEENKQAHLEAIDELATQIESFLH